MASTKHFAPGVVCFDSFTVDAERGLLLRDGIRLKLQPQPLRVLAELLAHAPNILSREELTQAVWPDVHVDADASLNFCIRQIRAALEDSASNSRYIETLPKQGYRFIGRIESPKREDLALPTAPPEAGDAAPVGFFVPEPFATPHVAAHSSPEELHSEKRRSRPGLLVIVAIVVLLGGVTAIWYGRRAAPPAASTSLHSLAVLPLANVSGDPGQEYLAEGMTDELITQLARTSSLRVVSRTSVMEYRDAHRPIREIAQGRGVDGIVEGSIARSGDNFHLTVQLIRAATDTHLWAESYDRPFDALAVVPVTAATAVARETGSLRPGLSASTRAIDPAAHDAYLRGSYLWFNGQNEAAGRLFLRATELQPDYALAWSGLCSYYGAGTLDLRHELDPRVALPLAYAAAQRAVELDPALADAHLSLGGTLFLFRWNWAETEAEISRAIELDPKLYQAVHLRAKILNVLNRPEEAIQTEKAAEELNPFARPWGMAQTLLTARHFDEALAAAKQRSEGAPDNANLQYVLTEIYRAMGLHAETVQALARWLEEAGDPRGADGVREAFRRGGYTAVLHWQLHRLEQQQARQYVSPIDFAEVHAELGERKETLDDMEEGFRQHAPGLLWVQTEPAFDFLHTEPRYRSLIQRMGLPPMP